jgi:chaperonin GroES
MKVFDKYVLVRQSPAQEKKGNLYLVSPGNNEVVIDGTIEAIGANVTEAQVGDKVHFNKHSAYKVKIQDVEYLVVKENELLVAE